MAVELNIGDKTAMCIVIGREESHVEFYSSTDSPPVVGCRGPWDDETLISFTFHGQYSEVPKRYTVPIADAREALRRFLEIRTRPDNIAWGK